MTDIKSEKGEPHDLQHAVHPSVTECLEKHSDNEIGADDASIKSRQDGYDLETAMMLATMSAPYCCCCPEVALCTMPSLPVEEYEPEAERAIEVEPRHVNEMDPSAVLWRAPARSQERPNILVKRGKRWGRLRGRH